MKVFEPFKLGNLELKNRMVVSAMVTNYCSPDGRATEKFIAYHEHKARGGWGLIITEDYAVTGVQPVAPSPVKEPSMPETPRELTVEEIHELVEQFGDCARRAREAGFDAVEVHGDHPEH